MWAGKTAVVVKAVGEGRRTFFSSSGERTMSSFFLSAPLPFLPPFYFFLFSAFPLIRLARRKSGGEHTRFKSPFTKVERDAWRREGPLVKDKPSSFAVRPCFPPTPSTPWDKSGQGRKSVFEGGGLLRQQVSIYTSFLFLTRRRWRRTSCIGGSQS